MRITIIKPKKLIWMTEQISVPRTKDELSKIERVMKSELDWIKLLQKCWMWSIKINYQNRFRSIKFSQKDSKDLVLFERWNISIVLFI